MAVTSLLTLIEDMEGSPSLIGPGSGNAGGTNDDIFIEGSQSIGRRVDNATNKGLGCEVSAVDLSAAGTHVVGWLWITQWAQASSNRIRLGDGTNDDDHSMPASYTPQLGGFLPVWLHVNRTPETGGSANEAAITDFVFFSNLANVGGAANNYIVDAWHYGTSGARWDGASGDIDDFITYENTNREGLLVESSGVVVCYARLEIGSSTATTFTDSGRTVVFPDQPLVQSTFMGLSIDLQNASTAISLTDSVIASGDPAAATSRPDFVVSSSSGTFDGSRTRYDGLRLVTLNAACTLDDSVFANIGQITADGASLQNSAVSGYEGTANTSAVVWDVASDPNGELDGMTFTMGSTLTHAIEFGTSSPLTMTLTGITFTGYNASNNLNDSTFHIKRTSGTVTINLSGCSGNFSYRTDGADVEIVNNPVTVKVTTVDASGSVITGARVLLQTAGSGPYPFDDSVTATQTSGTATVTHTGHALATNDHVVISGANEVDYNGVHQITVVDANSYTFSIDSGAASPATGTLLSSYAPLSGLSDGSGIVTQDKVFGSNQAVSGTARKGTSSPLYKPSSISGTIDSSAGFNQNVVMISDE